MDDAKLEDFFGEFLRIYDMSEDRNVEVDENVEVCEGGTYSAIDFAIEELGKMFEIRQISDRCTVLLNEKDKTALYTGLCCRSCKYYLFIYYFYIISFD